MCKIKVGKVTYLFFPATLRNTVNSAVTPGQYQTTTSRGNKEVMKFIQVTYITFFLVSLFCNYTELTVKLSSPLVSIKKDLSGLLFLFAKIGLAYLSCEFLFILWFCSCYGSIGFFLHLKKRLRHHWGGMRRCSMAGHRE